MLNSFWRTLRWQPRLLLVNMWTLCCLSLTLRHGGHPSFLLRILLLLLTASLLTLTLLTLRLPRLNKSQFYKANSPTKQL